VNQNSLYIKKKEMYLLFFSDYKTKKDQNVKPFS